MSTAVIDDVRKERDEAINAARTIAEAESFDPADENYQALRTRAEKLDKRIEQLVELAEQQSAADAFEARLAKAARRKEDQIRAEEVDAQLRHGGLQTRESPGEMFVRSENFTQYPGRGSSSRFEIEGYVETGLQTRAPLTTSDFGEVLLPVRRELPDVALRLRVFDVITVVPVTSNSVEIVSYEFNSAADDVPEGQPKPEATMTAKVEPLALNTQAHWIELTRQLIEDAPSVRSRVDNGLRDGVIRKMAANAMAVILDGIGTYATTSAPTMLAGIRQAIAMLETVNGDDGEGYAPNGVFLNPADFADMDIELLSTTGVPTIGQSYWGVVPIPWSTVPAGTALVGDFRAAVEHYRRTAAQVYITDSHASNFTSNIFTLLGEGRSASALVKPNAIVEVTVASDAGSGGSGSGGGSGDTGTGDAGGDSAGG